MRSDKITIVTPIGSKHKDAWLYENIQKPSMEYIYNFEHLLISDSKLLKPTHSDSDIIDMDMVSNNKGWCIQQIIKLMASKHVETEWFMTMDADCFFMQRGDAMHLLFKDGKPKMKTHKLNIKPRWWAACSKYLGKPNPPIHCSVTPCIYHTQLTRDICEAVNLYEAIHPHNNCTENALYWTYYWPMIAEMYALGETHYAAIFSLDEEHIYTNLQNFIERKYYGQFPIGFIQSVLPITVEEHMEIYNKIKGNRDGI